MRIFLYIYLLFVPIVVFCQTKPKPRQSLRKEENDTVNKKKKIATIDLYRIISIEKDTTYIDTTLSIQREYSHNFLRKDNFGLLSFPNEGQAYTTLQYSLTDFSPYPTMGFTGKHFSFMKANDIRYASVATPMTEMFYKSTMGRGQLVDTYFAINMTPRLNFSLAYKGLNSKGIYLREFVNSSHFRFTTSYQNKSGRYQLNGHITSQDIFNQENGGLTNTADFEGDNPDFLNRESIEVYLNDAESVLAATRFFTDQTYRINPTLGSNNLYINHQFNYEDKFFEYNQETLASAVGITTVNRFGDSFVTSLIKDRTTYNKMYNKFAATYENTTLGKFQFFVDDFKSNFYYHKIIVQENGFVIPSLLNRQINSAGGLYQYQKNKWTGKFLYSRSITNQSLSNLDAKMQLDLNDQTQFSFQFQNINKLPTDIYNLYQSNYVSYNWFNNFKNEKINQLSAHANTRWGTASLMLMTLNDYLYFKNVATNDAQQIIAPQQYDGTINYVSLKINKEFKFWKIAFDNTILYQKVDQSANVLNVPELVSRNTLYLTNYFFKKALLIQTGFILNYFSSYYANDYNALTSEFFVQNKKKIGNYPNLDFFVNAKIERARVFIKVEHFNASLTGNNYFSAPSIPYRDLHIRFGLVWDFFN